ncbi:innexin shaking-B-like [Penaeus monodon]|uniref:innexin shaking-B-like n=1 Tax=Penaeus monodon TaxID=6687 RepID=UPI0018A6FA27|nr:innexin shaking-B-like [Penaeus monodon]
MCIFEGNQEVVTLLIPPPGGGGGGGDGGTGRNVGERTCNVAGLLFYAPHYIWKTWEGGRMQSITADLSVPILNKEDQRKRVNQLADYLQNSLWNNNTYALKYLFCQCLSLVNCIVNMVLMNKFLNGKFLTYGADVFSYSEAVDQESRTDPMIEVFPRVTKCSMSMFGSSGTLQKHDFLCVLAVNVINEKIYLAMWLWFILLISLSILVFFFHLAVFAVPVIRRLYLVYLLGSGDKARIVARTFNQMGDVFLLYLLKKNVECQSLNLLLTELCREPITGDDESKKYQKYLRRESEV